MISGRIILAFILMLLILITCVCLFFLENGTYEVIDPVRRDPYHEIIGSWYVIAVITPNSEFPRARCWTVKVLEISTDTCVVISKFTEATTMESTFVTFRTSVSEKNGTLIASDIRVKFGGPTIDLKIHHVSGKRDILALSIVDDKSDLFDFLILSTKPMLTSEDKDLFRADIYVNNTHCE